MADVDGDEDAKNCKVVLLGESGVGKTSIISRFINDAFEEGCVSTTGASYVSKDLVFKDYKNQLVKFEIWDTAGQEKYRSLTKFFYKDAAAVILVYDVTREESFENLKNYWYNQLKENCDKNVVLGVVGNKCDLFEDEKVTENDAREFADKIGAIFELTSAQNNTGITEIFQEIGNKYLDPNFQQRIKQVEKEKTEEGKAQNIVLDNNENKTKEKPKKKGFC